MDPLVRLSTSGIRYLLGSYTALDRYFRHPPGPHRYITVFASLVEIARTFDDVVYPGIEGWDAAIDWEGARYYLHCAEPEDRLARFPVSVLDFYYDPQEDRYLDPLDQYENLRNREIPGSEIGVSFRASLAVAVLRARYRFSGHLSSLESLENCASVEPELVRTSFSDVLTGIHATEGLELLSDLGFIDCYLDELPAMRDTAHSKEHHPEGDVWKHSLETLRYRKVPDLRLSLGLLFHDSGKPFSGRTKEHAFDKHAELGAAIARRSLRRLGFDEDLIGDVDYLVSNHMYPGALSRLPVSRTEPLMRSRLFPLLLELYRCDLSSTYRGPDGYYQACRVYRAFLKNRANPFRSAAGKKLLKLYVE
jgi:poly(A) polymerase